MMLPVQITVLNNAARKSQQHGFPGGDFGAWNSGLRIALLFRYQPGPQRPRHGKHGAVVSGFAQKWFGWMAAHHGFFVRGGTRMKRISRSSAMARPNRVRESGPVSRPRLVVPPRQPGQAGGVHHG